MNMRTTAREPVLEHGMPASPDVERLLLGAIQLDGDRFGEIAAVLSPEDFSLEKHRRIFARMMELHSRGEQIDRITVAEELKQCGQLDSVDGLGYLVSLDQGLPEIVRLDGFIRIVKDKAILRRTMVACQRIMDQCVVAGEPSAEILDTAAVLLDRIRGEGASKQGRWMTPGDVLR